MKTTNIYLLLLLSLILGFSCSDKKEIETPPTPEKEWDKTRTAKIMFISDLTGKNPYNINNYERVVSFIKLQENHISVLDKANVFYNGIRKNPGATIAVQAEKYPIFVPTSKTTDEYVGSSVLFNKTIPQMELIMILQDCFLFPLSTEIKPGLTTRIAILSLDSENQIEASAIQLKSLLSSSTLVIGTIKRSLVSQLTLSLSQSMTANSYSFAIIDNMDKNSEYGIYTFNSPKWKFRNLNESIISNNIKSFLIEIEYL